ncbi:hypothetical protein SELMODRAFT_448010 [Selaginella moellendorffii]|uniref:2-phosphoglycerate kinase n=1 Tax=Selaginella moellendorffii TaxID=88036 RepID=D8T453_SELML|nr:hypothetical protein SELMODRAFT_448010 [Selaginella moellendorffii]
MAEQQEIESSDGGGGGSSKDKAAAAPLPPADGSRPPRHATSKYDFVKVRVWLGENSDHYYVFSRFLLSRMLTVTKIPHHVAIKIALELKKLLVDNSLLDVSQTDLEANVFKLMERRGYGTDYINRYKMMTRFHHQRIPLIILVCGTACVGKSTIATQLAQRLNLPNVLQASYLSLRVLVVRLHLASQTDMVYELLRSSTEAPLTSTPIWERQFETKEELITEFCRECRIVRKGLDGDLTKAMKDGKPVIIEGIHLDPSIYLMEENGRASPVNKAEDGDSEKSPAQCDGKQQLNEHENGSAAKPKAIIVPIVLSMADIDHQEEEAALIVKLRTIQDYLTSFESQGVGVVPISATTFPQTLDWLHGYLLQRIERDCQEA